jgi:hypothetical protein
MIVYEADAKPGKREDIKIPEGLTHPYVSTDGWHKITDPWPKKKLAKKHDSDTVPEAKE